MHPDQIIGLNKGRKCTGKKAVYPQISFEILSMELQETEAIME